MGCATYECWKCPVGKSGHSSTVGINYLASPSTAKANQPFAQVVKPAEWRRVPRRKLETAQRMLQASMDPARILAAISSANHQLNRSRAGSQRLKDCFNCSPLSWVGCLAERVDALCQSTHSTSSLLAMDDSLLGHSLNHPHSFGQLRLGSSAVASFDGLTEFLDFSAHAAAVCTIPCAPLGVLAHTFECVLVLMIRHGVLR